MAEEGRREGSVVVEIPITLTMDEAVILHAVLEVAKDRIKTHPVTITNIQNKVYVGLKEATGA
jgi:hypothetical protein